MVDTGGDDPVDSGIDDVAARRCDVPDDDLLGGVVEHDVLLVQRPVAVEEHAGTRTGADADSRRDLEERGRVDPGAQIDGLLRCCALC